MLRLWSEYEQLDCLPAGHAESPLLSSGPNPLPERHDSVEPVRPTSRLSGVAWAIVRGACWVVVWSGLLVLVRIAIAAVDFRAATGWTRGGPLLALAVPLLVGGVCSVRRTGYHWGWLFAVIIFVHTLVLESLLATRLWQPDIMSLRGLLLAFVFSGAVLFVSLVRCLAQRKLSVNLCMLYLAALANFVWLYELVHQCWRVDALG